MSIRQVRSGSLDGFPELLDELGGNANSVFRLHGVSPSLIENPDNLFAASTMVDLLEFCAREFDCPDFGLRLAEKQSVRMLGLVGLLVQQCQTLGEALEGLRRFLHVHSQAGSIELDTSSETAFIGYVPGVYVDKTNRQLIDLTLASGFTILYALSNRRLKPSAVYFSYPKPTDLQLYRKRFLCPLHFSAAYNGVAISRRSLDLPLSQEDSGLRHYVDQHLRNQAQEAPLSLEDRVRTCIRQCLPLQQCKLEQVAELLDTEPRTLQRRLQDRDTGFQQLLTEERCALAKRYLKESDISISHLSQLLGYGETAVFSRCFKRWTGQTPTQYLKDQGTRTRLRAAAGP